MNRTLHTVDDNDSFKTYRAGDVCADWHVGLYIHVMFCEEYDREWAKNGQYHVSIEAVAPAAVSDENIEAACKCMGITRADFDGYNFDVQCRTLAEYGIKAVLWQQQGDNETELVEAAKQETGRIEMLFGFYMDKPMNAIGNSGWDFIQGEIGFTRK